MVSTTDTSDMIEEKLETGFHNSTDLILKEMTELKNQFEKSVSSTKTIPFPRTTITQEPSSSWSSNTQDATNTTVEGTEQQTAGERSHNVFIAGDCITSILSQNKMVHANIQVKIKSHSNGSLKDIHDTIITMAQDDDEYICDIDAFIIHAGTNNLSDGGSIESVTKQYKELAETVKHINYDCPIIISSVLPRKNDRLANQVIAETNRSLKQLCESESYIFLENTENFLSDGAPDASLYKVYWFCHDAAQLFKHKQFFKLLSRELVSHYRPLTWKNIESHHQKTCL